jgi:glutamate synthase domain-containing protein 2
MLESGITPDFITVDGAEGGTGAAPVEFTNRLGMMCLESVFLVHNALVGTGLRDRMKIIASGKTASSFDLLSKIAVGADSVNAARTMMMALGCIQSRHCNTNMCPTGVATQDPARSKAIDVQEKSERVKNFHHNTLESFFELVGSMGLDDPAKLMPQMVKRRTPYGQLMPSGNLLPPLEDQDLLHESDISDTWKEWWRQAQSVDFYAEDKIVLHPTELT